VLRLLLLALLVSARAPQGVPPVDDAARAAILERSPAAWERAPEGTWKDWDADSVPPEALRPFLLRSVEAYRTGDMPAALIALFELLEAAPDHPTGLHQAGVIYFRLRRYGDAVVALERYLEVAPHRLGDTRVLGHCYYTLGDYEAARDHYRAVIALEPGSAEARRGLALSLMRLGESEAALEELGRVLELEPDHADAATWVAQILFDEERSEEALEAALRARDLDPFEPRPWFLLGQILYDLGRDEEGDAARERFDELTGIAQELRAAEARLLYDPRQPEVHARIVALHRQAGDLLSVGRALNRWRAVEPGRVAVHMALLDLAVELEDPAAADRLAENLRQVAGEDLAAWERLALHHASRRDRVRQAEAEAEVARLRAARGDGR
jgi:predicted Zn-dependent protease